MSLFFNGEGLTKRGIYVILDTCYKNGVAKRPEVGNEQIQKRYFRIVAIGVADRNDCFAVKRYGCALKRGRSRSVSVRDDATYYRYELFHHRLGAVYAAAWRGDRLAGREV